MTTAWTFPTIISQYPEEGGEDAHIMWNEDNGLDELKSNDGRSIQTNGTLHHIARSPKHDLRNKTYYIQATGFNFSNIPEVISGIEVRLNVRRYGRATDDTIQLCLNETPIGDNRATLEINPIKVYGSETDLWSTLELTPADLLDSTFGIVFRFQAHPHWPHRDPVLVDSVEMRIH